MDELFSTRDVARRVGVAEHHLVYALRQGYLEDVRIVAGKRLFTAADISRVRDYFDDKDKEKNERRR
jgi:DNA-binding transcriptional MerR regulator